jgi:uncharacterized NAD(P)/FAD-binding protein YdhS/glyoxylase-like metal-dependent hydrolase (beta-lactamase superfamily II)
MAADGSTPMIAILGAGFSGSMVACHLLRKAKRPLSIALIDRSGRFGPGVAYGTPDPGHLLNVSTGAMSAWPDDPSHLLRWLDLNREALVEHGIVHADGDGFLPRKIYGLYLESVLDEAETQAPPSVSLQRISTELLGLEPLHTPDGSSFPKGGYRLLFEEHPPLIADQVVLAYGNRPNVNFPHNDDFIRHGWHPNATSDLIPDVPVLLQGTGLTMVDTVVSLMGQGHRGPILALSRRGHQPIPHRIAPPIGAWLDPDAAPVTALALWKVVRQRAQQAIQDTGDWRPVIDGLRPITWQLWRNLPLQERHRFLRHAAVVWDVHRHRISPRIHHQLQELQRSGQLRFVVGRLLDVRILETGLHVEVRLRGSTSLQRLEVGRLIQCTGIPPTGSARLQPLLEQLHHRGLLAPDSLGIGLAASAQGELLQGSGAIAPGLHTLGSPLRGQRWESIAVPELREQAKQLAIALLRALPPHVRPLAPLSPGLPQASSPPNANEPALLMRQLFDTETSTFTYLLADPRTGDAALLDPVLGHEDRDLLLLQELKLSLRFCLETHLHADHITSAGQLRRRTGCSLIVPAAPGIRNADQLLYGGELLTLGTLSIEVIATPGHTPEHVAYRIGDHTLFTGDCLLIRGCGRTDFQNGNASDLYDSLQKLLSMPDSMVVYPGHDSKGRTSTTIVEEREFNPRIAGRSREAFIQLMSNLKMAPPKQISTALPANQHLGDFLPDGEQKWEQALDPEMQAAQAIETTNKDIINEYLGMFI